MVFCQNRRSASVFGEETMRKKYPKYCRCANRNIAFCYGNNGKSKIYFPGQYDSDESRQAYLKYLSALELGHPFDRSAKTTVIDLCVRFLAWAQNYYRKHGRSTGSYERFATQVIPPLLDRYHHTAIDNMGRQEMREIQNHYLQAGLARSTINQRMTLTKQIFRWGETEDLVPPEVCARVCALQQLKKDRSPARETDPVSPVSDADIEKTVLYLSSVVADMVFVQRHSAMRPGELFNMKWTNIDRTGAVWLYYPEEYKTEHHTKLRRRVIPLCKAIQDLLLQRYRDKAPEDYLFSPRDAVREQAAERAKNRKTPRQPSQIARAKAAKRREELVADHYNKDSYRTAIQRAAQRAGVPKWSPNQLRHTAATEIRAKAGLEAAQVVLGHSSAKTTEIYAEAATQKAIDAVQKIW